MNTIALEYLPNRFNIPQNITSVSSGFLDATFRSSRIRLYPTDFNIPLMITSIGPRFLMGTFRNNINLTKLPYNFSIPAVVGRAETYFDLCE
jgi:hypothetical protein